MTLNSIVALLGAMIVLAIVPSSSVFAVVARTISSGFTHGAITVAGILIGDFVFIILAIYGLSAIAGKITILSLLIKYLGGIYLIWLGIKMSRTKLKSIEIERISESSWLSSFFSGLLITLSDSKAIFFYLSFFPAFLDLKNLSIIDAIAILTTTTLAVGGTKLGYAYLANKSRSSLTSLKAQKVTNITAGSMMIITGIFLIVKN